MEIDHSLAAKGDAKDWSYKVGWAQERDRTQVSCVKNEANLSCVLYLISETSGHGGDGILKTIQEYYTCEDTVHKRNSNPNLRRFQNEKPRLLIITLRANT